MALTRSRFGVSKQQNAAAVGFNSSNDDDIDASLRMAPCDGHIREQCVGVQGQVDAISGLRGCDVPLADNASERREFCGQEQGHQAWRLLASPTCRVRSWSKVEHAKGFPHRIKLCRLRPTQGAPSLQPLVGRFELRFDLVGHCGRAYPAAILLLAQMLDRCLDGSVCT